MSTSPETPLRDEDGKPITDADGNIITTERLKKLEQYADETARKGSTPDADGAIADTPKMSPVTVRLPDSDIAELQAQAEKSGIGYTTLIRIIVREYLENDTAAASDGFGRPLRLRREGNLVDKILSGRSGPSDAASSAPKARKARNQNR